MKLKSLKQAKLAGKRVLIRVEYNVPLKNGKITDDLRIKESIQTIQYILSKKPKQLIIATHIGRPKAKEKALSTQIVAKKLQSLLKRKVMHVNHAGEKPLPEAEVVMLENLRFYEGEKKGDATFAKQLANTADIYVNESFGTCHRKDASMYVVPKYVKEKYAGFLVEKEIQKLSEVLTPKKPFVVIIGFAKIADKIQILEKLLKKADKVLVGGAVIFSFLKAQGYEIGKGLCDEASVPIAKRLLKYKSKLVFPIDITGIHKKKIAKANYDQIPADFAGYDIGAASVTLFKEELAKAKTVFWNGPLGMFEKKPFDAATKSVARFLSKNKTKTIVGGGDTAAAVKGVKLYHISTGGGAALEFIQKGSLPALKWIKK